MTTVRAANVHAGKRYSIRGGDTLWAIASRLKAQGVGGSVKQIIALIQRLNPSITNPNLIIAGHALRLPAVGALADRFSRAARAPVNLGSNSPAQQVGPSAQVALPADSSSAEAFRAQVAQWAIAQADDPSIGYSQTKGRFGNATDAQGHRFFDCSGLVTAAYAQYGVKLGANYTAAMRATWPQWAQQVPKSTSAMKPGDLILMNGHVVMYIGGGKCVGAQGTGPAFQEQVTTHIDAQHYLSRPDAIVLRPNVPDGLLQQRSA
jgi:cell wall-associated NlpC family hydrolase